MTRRKGPPARATGPPGGRRRRPAPRRAPGDDVRAAAAWAIERTLASLAPVDTYLAPLVGRFDPRDQGLLNELVMGTLRWLRRIDQVLARASHRRFERIERPLWAPLRVAAYQILFLDRVPAHAAVHEAVEQARAVTHKGGASFVNAVLRRIAREPRLEAWPVDERDPVRRLAIEMSHPDFLVERWRRFYGEAGLAELLAANNRPKPLQLLAFRDRGGRELLAEALIDEGIEVEPSALSPLGLTVRRGDPLSTAAFARGDFYVQDEASQAAALVPPPRPGERVLDLAAAPGGKTFALLASEPDLAAVMADVSLVRLARVGENLGRLGRRVPRLVSDAGLPPFGASFDRVVLDLPCSGTGTLRRHPELKWRISEEEIGRLAAQGLRLAEGAVPLLAPGGLLVAITCSIEPEENERVAERLLAAHPELEPAELAGALPVPADRGLVGEGFWRLLPGDDHDGFSVSVLRRRKGG